MGAPNRLQSGSALLKVCIVPAHHNTVSVSLKEEEKMKGRKGRRKVEEQRTGGWEGREERKRRLEEAGRPDPRKDMLLS